MARVVTVAGTWGIEPGNNADWWRPGSDFWKVLAAGGCEAPDEADPFVWSTALDGVDRRNRIWETAGRALVWYAGLKCPGERVSVVAHSHGGQVLAYAAAAGLPIDTAITVATPVRADLAGEYKLLRDRALRWVHIYTDEERGMPWQRMGQLGVNTLGGRVHQPMPLCNENIHQRGETHGSLVSKAALWRPVPVGQGWRDLLVRA